MRARTTSLLNAGKIPALLQESLSSGVNALVAETPTCLPVVPASSPTPEATPPPARAHGQDGKRHSHGHGHHKNKKK